MAVVAEYILDSGARVKINNDAYKDKAPEELEKIKNDLNEVASRLIYQQIYRKALK